MGRIASQTVLVLGFVGCLIKDVLGVTMNFDFERKWGNAWVGFATSRAWTSKMDAFPSSIEFQYVPLKDVMKGPSSFDWDEVEGMLDDAMSRKNHLVLRFWVDYPALPSGMPSFLASTPCHEYSDYGGGCSPYYTNTTFQDALLTFVEELGVVFDGDRRIGAIQVGLLGFWGEWHTYPHESWMAPLSFQQSLTDAFRNTFSTTPWLLRYPDTDLGTDYGMHDDSLTYSTLGKTSWYFWPSVEREGMTTAWKEHPMGGEIRPENQKNLFKASFGDDSNEQPLNDCTDTVHLSWALNAYAFDPGYTGIEEERAKKGAARMGYGYHLETLVYDWLPPNQTTLKLSATICNRGVAPSYYPLTASIFTPSTNTTHDRISLHPLLPNECDTLLANLTRDLIEERVLSHLRISSEFLLPGQSIQLSTASYPPILTTTTNIPQSNDTTNPPALTSSITTILNIPTRPVPTPPPFDDDDDDGSGGGGGDDDAVDGSPPGFVPMHFVFTSLLLWIVVLQILT